MVRPKSTETPAREKILHTAADLFFSQGYYQTGTNQIIDEAGISKATFYANYPTKEDLAVAYVRHSAVSAMKIIQDRVNSMEDLYQRYFMFYQAVHDFLVNTDYRGCNFSNIAREFPNKESRVRQEVISFETDYREALRDAVACLFESDPKHFKSINLSIDEVTDRYYLLLEGAITASANLHNPWPLGVAAKAIRELVNMPKVSVIQQ